MKSALLRIVLSGFVAFAFTPAAPAAPRLAGAPSPSFRAPPPSPGSYSGPDPVSNSGVVRVELTGQGPAARTLALGKGKSALIELPIDARDISVTNPAVADVVLRTPRRISVLGVANGDTDAVFFDGMGHPILRLDIRVDQDSSGVADAIARVLPSAHVRVEAVNNSLILSGQVQSASDADKAQQIAAQFVDKPEHVLNMLGISGQDQVMLKVRIVEVQRTAIKQLGFNMSAILGQVGGNQIISGLAPTYGINGALLGGLTGAGLARNTTSQVLASAPSDCDKTTVIDTSNMANCVGTARAGSNGLNQANAQIQAFERAGLVRTLAEPNLTAVSGEPAKFLVGGEFPVPTGQDNSGRVTIEFKQFGVGLGFTPVVLSGGRISLKLSTEVSELSNIGSFTLSAGAGSPSVVVPSLEVRQAQTTVELPSGGSMMIAGLLQNETKQDLDSLPGLMTLPILGALFRSRDYQSGETELVIIVTPYLVKATSADRLQTPADGLEIASDSQSILLGRLNKVYKAPPEAVEGRTYQGPYGYVIE
ncbi:MAG TPA: type II and III secretion system protein family protein [Caulobacteraceae bacterium]